MVQERRQNAMLDWGRQCTVSSTHKDCKGIGATTTMRRFAVTSYQQLPVTASREDATTKTVLQRPSMLS